MRLYNALRNGVNTLIRHPAYVALNALSLALAIGSCLLLFWYIRFHVSVDRYHQKAERIVRLVTEVHQGATTYSSGIATPIGPALRQDMPWLNAVAMVIGQQHRPIQVQEPNGRLGAKFMEASTMAYAEPDLFGILDYKWLIGSPNSALKKPFTAVLTQRLARKYFGKASPIGRRLCMNNRLELTVTGLLADIPNNTDQPFELFVSYPTLNYYAHNGTPLDQWEGVSSQTQCWVLLPTASALDRFERALYAFHRQRSPATLDTYQYRVVPLLDQHTIPNYYTGIRRDVLIVLGVIGGLLLLTACVNFINMATAQSLRRGREIGVRRVIGATRRRVFWQFLVETGLITSLAAGVAIVLAYTFLPVLRKWTQTPVPFTMSVHTWAFLLSLVGLATIGAGTYPGLVLAGFRPALVLKGQAIQQQIRGLSLRRLLVVGQLAINMGFTIAVVVMSRQLTFWLRANSGFNASNRVSIPVQMPLATDLSSFKRDLLRIPGVEAVSFSDNAPVGGITNTYYVRFANRPQVEPFQMITFPVDSSYMGFYNIPLVAGRPLPDRDTTTGFLINETALHMLGFTAPAEVIGRTLTIPYTPEIVKPILGVVQDWRQASFKKPVQPMVLYTSRGNYSSCHLHLKPAHQAATLARVQTIWNRYFPAAVYGELHLDVVISDFYAEEAEQLRFVQLAAGVAIAIGSVGLLGLIVFLTSRRTREIAIRKALGASEGAIVWLFLREFIYLLAVAFALAAPVVWWLMHRWLNHYATSIPLTPDLLFTGLVLVSLTTLLTIGFHTLRIALANPAQALRTE
ncbi:ABC transporter permease [Spirosoma endbachense]|uniref:FtsX-like permease family protein n=1 Tax=Spirosoma endbachense TaxID=2666025 RepID=A0A6P1VR21_9BACT|nr:ABC transporter permease [Spirosoma endbachense]QHV94562.1 FtsX-like permease family protein [Spirosoma endbachense]